MGLDRSRNAGSALDFHLQQREAVRLALRIGLEALAAAAAERVAQQEVEREHVLGLVARDLALADAVEVPLYGLDGQRLLNEFVVGLGLHEDADVAAVALVAAASPGTSSEPTSFSNMSFRASNTGMFGAMVSIR